jgi:uncharacterized protein YdeI (BOF family)
MQPGLPPPRRFQVGANLLTTAAIILILAVGAAAGAGASRYIEKSRPQPVLLLTPEPIAQLTAGSPVAVKGQVAEIFGNKFIVQDGSGRALIETGPRGEGGNLVTKGETVTVQGRFDDGFIHANVMTRADGSSQAFGPPAPPRHRRGPDDRPGLRADRLAGPDRGAGGEPPPAPAMPR